MRLKSTLAKDCLHSELVSCVGWTGPDEFFSAADDHDVKSSSCMTDEVKSVFKLSNDAFPTNMHWCPKSAGPTGKKASVDLFALTATDGKFYFIHKSGRVEKTVDAHKGAVLYGKWSHDGNDYVTGGEDGTVKIWSRNGMLRNTLAQNSVPVYCLAWSSNSDQILFTNGKQLVIKSLQASSKPTIWKAHDGIVLVVDWNPVNNFILSGAEDCKYKIWDTYGRVLYTSGTHDYPVTSLAWTPDGELFAVGSFNTLRLCDKAGWSYAMDKPQTGSIFQLAWSRDGTQVAGACGNGHVIVSRIVDRRLEWKNYEITLIESQKIETRNVVNNTVDKLDFRDRIIKMSLGFNHLIVGTAKQCYVYSVKNWNTPTIFELKEGNVTLILQTQKHFLLVDGTNVYVYSYDGRLICMPKYASMRADTLNSHTVSISNDTIAIRDKTDEMVIYLFDAQTGKATSESKVTHKCEVAQIALDQCGLPQERRLVIVDKNRDLFITSVKVFGTERRIIKLGTMVESLSWNDSANILAALSDNKFIVWYYPNVVYVDRDLLPQTIFTRPAGEFGRMPELVNFEGNHLIIRRAEGALVSSPVSPYPTILHDYITTNRWEDAVRLCRFVKDPALWACLAAMSAYNKELSTAEIAYAAISEADKVQFIQNIKDIPSKEARAAEMALFCGNSKDAEALLLQANLIFRAIMLNIQLYNWERALELAVKHKTHVDTVLAYRQHYLHKFDKAETSKRFTQYSEGVNVDWTDINAKIELEYQKERERPTQPSAPPAAAPRTKVPTHGRSVPSH